MFGLPENALKLIQSYFASQPEVVKVFIFGSRAMGREKPGSDIDLALITTSDHDISAHVKGDLEELPLPYLFDVVDYERIAYTPLREHIDRVGKVLFERS